MYHWVETLGVRVSPVTRNRQRAEEWRIGLNAQLMNCEVKGCYAEADVTIPYIAMHITPDGLTLIEGNA